MSGKFVLEDSPQGKYHFNLKASNGEIIATSEVYNSKASALNGIDSVRTNASTAVLVDETS
ncbi:MAG: YegP family protein [bacterium]